MGMRSKTSLEAERRAAHKFFESFPQVAALFEDEWKSRALSPSVARLELPPFFWFLTDEHHSKVIGEALELLSQDAHIGPVIGELQVMDDTQVNSLVRELEVYRLLRLQNTDVEWKPKLSGLNPKRPDLAVRSSGRRIYLEVFTITQSGPDREEAKILNRLNQRIDEIPENPYLISYSIEGEFGSEDVDPCGRWLRETIETLPVPLTEGTSVAYSSHGQKKLIFTFFSTRSGKGGYGATMHQMRMVNESRRVKNRFLDKLDALQFPSDSHDAKGYVIVLDAIFLDYEEALAAILGRSAIQVQMTGTNRTTKWIRQEDGVAHDPTRGKILIEEIDFIAMFRPKGRAIEGKPEIIPNGGPGKMTRPEVERLFTESSPRVD